jgi:hypothetical protein
MPLQFGFHGGLSPFYSQLKIQRPPAKRREALSGRVLETDFAADYKGKRKNRISLAEAPPPPLPSLLTSNP